MVHNPKISMHDIETARRALKNIIHHTPLIPSRTLSMKTGGPVYLKAENLQRTGSFKIRGAYYRLQALSEEEKRRGVVTASAGNHAQGVAWAARELGIHARVVMPKGASIAKIEATRGYGAEVILAGAEYDEAAELAQKLSAEDGSVYIHAFDDPYVVAGQGTLALEVIQDLPQLDYILVPIGGGGLLSGVGFALKSLNPRIRVIGVEAKGTHSMTASLERGEPVNLSKVQSIADGLAVKQPSELTFNLTKQVADEVVVVEEDAVAHAILFLLERARLVVEGSGAVGVAALLNEQVKVTGTGVIVLSGGNIDMNIIARIIERGLVTAGRFLRLYVQLPDRPGSLQKLLHDIAQLGANILSVEHDRLQAETPFGTVKIGLVLETRNEEHAELITASLRSTGHLLE